MRTVGEIGEPTQFVGVEWERPTAIVASRRFGEPGVDEGAGVSDFADPLTGRVIGRLLGSAQTRTNG